MNEVKFYAGSDPDNMVEVKSFKKEDILEACVVNDEVKKMIGERAEDMAQYSKTDYTAGATEFYDKGYNKRKEEEKDRLAASNADGILDGYYVGYNKAVDDCIKLVVYNMDELPQQNIMDIHEALQQLKNHSGDSNDMVNKREAKGE